MATERPDDPDVLRVLRLVQVEQEIDRSPLVARERSRQVIAALRAVLVIATVALVVLVLLGVMRLAGDGFEWAAAAVAVSTAVGSTALLWDVVHHRGSVDDRRARFSSRGIGAGV